MRSFDVDHFAFLQALHVHQTTQESFHGGLKECFLFKVIGKSLFVEEVGIGNESC